MELKIFMNYVDKIFDRVDIQHIREFLLHGVECCNISSESYSERLINAEKMAINFLHSLYNDDDEFEKSTMPMFEYARTIEEVYMEIGLQSGIILGMQIASHVNKQLNGSQK